jgi:hypothetical protein
MTDRRTVMAIPVHLGMMPTQWTVDRVIRTLLTPLFFVVPVEEEYNQSTVPGDSGLSGPGVL